MKKENNQSNKMIINWPDLYFLSIADREKFIETTVVTLRAHYRDTIINHVYKEMSQTNDVTDPNLYLKVQAKANVLMNEGAYPVCEFVQADEDRATVCLNVKNIDRIAVEIALERLASLERIEPGAYIEFGTPTTFSADEVFEICRKH